MFGLSSFWKTKKSEPVSTVVLPPDNPSDAQTNRQGTVADSSLQRQIDQDLNQAEEALRQAVSFDNTPIDAAGNNINSSEIEPSTNEPSTIELSDNETAEIDSAAIQQAVLDQIALRPEGEYILFEQAANSLPRRILEIGIDDGQRAECLIRFASLVIPPSELFYFGLDWFEERTENQRPGLEYMQAFQQLRLLGVAARLQPGDPGSDFLSVANSLTAKKVDWVMISEEILPKTMRKLWPLFPRIIDDNTRFFIEKGAHYRLVPPAEVNRIAQKAQKIQSGR